MIAGKIVPAIASTTAAVVGIVALQLYVLKSTEDIKNLRNCYFDLARNVICFENVRMAKYIKDGNDQLKQGSKKYKLIPEKYTIWDYLVINDSLSIKQFIDYMKKNYNVEITSIISNQIILYTKNESGNDDLKINKKIEEVFGELSEIKIFENKKFLILEILGDIDEFIAKMPLIKYNFKK